MASDFKPAWWLSGPHSQTLWPFLFKRKVKLSLRSERLELPDGDFVDLCWTTRQSGPIVAIFHGLEGCIDSHYAKGMLAAIEQQQWRGVFMHFRGCSDNHNRLPRSYHSGDTGDIAFLLQTLTQQYPDTPIAAIGYSLGANALLKYLGEGKYTPPLQAAAVVSTPFLLANGAETLEQGFSRIYQRYLLRRLQKKLFDKNKYISLPISLNNINELNTFRLFDDQVTAPLHGFKDVDDYYKQSSCRQYLKAIRIPTLICHARDDPFMTEVAIPSQEELSSHISMEISDKGGHVGFISGKFPWQCHYWLEQRIPSFFKHIFTK